MGPTLYSVTRNNVFWIEISPNRKAKGSLRRMDVNGWHWTQDVGCGSPTSELEVSSHYHKSGDFQDNTANREFFGLTQDWAFRSWGISAVRFSGYLWQYRKVGKIYD
jgi:hypothetical protein